MKKLICVFLFINLLAAQISFAQTLRPTSFDNREFCEQDRGVWREFGSGCVDSCRSKLDRFMICTMAITYGCDCGKGRCWEGNKCVDAKEYKVIFDEKKALKKEYLDAKKEERKEDFKANRSLIAKKLQSFSIDRTAKILQEQRPVIKQNTIEQKPNYLSPLAEFLANNIENNNNKEEEKSESTTPVKQKFEIPSFFIKKKQAAEKMLAEQAKSGGVDTKDGNTTAPTNDGIGELPTIPLPN